jgi:hypothetical protein
LSTKDANSTHILSPDALDHSEKSSGVVHHSGKNIESDEARTIDVSTCSPLRGTRPSGAVRREWAAARGEFRAAQGFPEEVMGKKELLSFGLCWTVVHLCRVL